MDSSGNIYIADTGNNVIRKVTAATGIITTVAGNGHAGYSGDGGTATSAELVGPVGVAVDKSGNIYIADSAALRKVAAATGIINTMAPYNYITNARVVGIAVDGSGNIYIAYSQNGGFSVIQKTTAATGITTRVGGTFYFSGISGVAVDASGNIYIAESNIHTVNNPTGATLKMTAAGIVTTIAGQANTVGFSGDGGPATSAELDTPAGVAVDGSGMDGFMLADRMNHNPNLTRPVIMMLSSSDLQSDIPRCRRLGIVCHVVKPVCKADLRESMLRALGTAPAEPPAHDEKVTESLRRLSILLAEDNPMNKRLATRLLEKRGHRITSVSNGREALEALDLARFDVILMDVQMPVMDGWMATQAIRERERGTEEHVPILALTAHAMKHDQEQCLAAGMDGYLSKPFQPAELYAAVESIAGG